MYRYIEFSGRPCSYCEMSSVSRYVHKFSKGEIKYKYKKFFNTN